MKVLKGILLVAYLLSSKHTKAQETIGWQFKSPSEGILGCSILDGLDSLEGQHSDTIVVAIIDNGAQTLHEDLEGQIWLNPKEIAGNGIDDDGNGYVDDVHGWNFLGNAQGECLKNARVELARIYKGFENGEQVADYEES